MRDDRFCGMGQAFIYFQKLLKVWHSTNWFRAQDSRETKISTRLCKISGSVSHFCLNLSAYFAEIDNCSDFWCLNKMRLFLLRVFSFSPHLFDGSWTSVKRMSTYSQLKRSKRATANCTCTLSNAMIYLSTPGVFRDRESWPVPKEMEESLIPCWPVMEAMVAGVFANPASSRAMAQGSA